MKRIPLPQMPTRVWGLLAVDLVSFAGNGLLLPFLIVYLHRVRHLSLPTAGLALSTIAISGFLGTVIAGGLVDRIGSRKTLILLHVIAGLGAAAIAFVHSPWQAFVSAAIYGLGASGYWPAIQSLLATAVPTEQRDGVFSLHFMALNAGIGLGAVVGGALVNIANPASFVRVYLVDAATFLLFAAVLTQMRSLETSRSARVQGPAPTASYAEVLKDRVFVRICLVVALLVTVGTAQLTSGFPAFATGRGGASTHVLGFAFGANTFTIVILQLWVSQAIQRHRRTRVVMGTCVMWVICWTVTLLAGLHGGGTLSDAGFVLALTLFAVGEMGMAPSLPALVNHLASEHLRGRYNAMHSLSFSSGFFLGPALAGFLLGKGAGPALFVVLIVGLGLVAVFLRWLETQIPEEANRVRQGEGEPVLHQDVVPATEA